MKATSTPLQDVILLEPRVCGDERGFFLESWNERTFRDLGIDAHFVQDNHSCSRRGILRGLHYQKPRCQGKMVWAIEGEVYDVVVDLRLDSKTYGKWHGFTLSAENKHRLWIPEGFAHGFYVVSERAQFLYKCTDYYSPADEQTLAWNDASLNITWPIPVGEEPLLSEKDKHGKSFAECEKFGGTQPPAAEWWEGEKVSGTGRGGLCETAWEPSIAR